MSRSRPLSPRVDSVLRHPVSRRSVLASALALSTAGVVTACSGDQAPQATGGGDIDVPKGPWSFTDDTGRTVELEQTPTRIAGLTDQVAALWNLGIVPVAAFGYTPMADDVAFAGKPVDEVVEAGAGYGEIDLEALAGAAPDLLVTTVYPESSDGDIAADALLYGFKDAEQQRQVDQIVPVVAIAQRGTALDVIERNVELVAALGVDVTGGAVAEARAEFEAAGDELSAAAERSLSVLAIAAYPDDGIYVAKAPDDPALRYYTELGVAYADVGGDAYYWDTVSWENADRYRTDIVLNSLRAMTIDDLADQPTFARLPAAEADQVFDWKFQSMDYTAQASYMRELADLLAGSEKVT